MNQVPLESHTAGSPNSASDTHPHQPGSIWGACPKGATAPNHSALWPPPAWAWAKHSWKGWGFPSLGPSPGDLTSCPAVTASTGSALHPPGAPPFGLLSHLPTNSKGRGFFPSRGAQFGALWPVLHFGLSSFTPSIGADPENLWGEKPLPKSPGGAGVGLSALLPSTAAPLPTLLHPRCARLQTRAESLLLGASVSPSTQWGTSSQTLPDSWDCCSGK